MGAPHVYDRDGARDIHVLPDDNDVDFYSVGDLANLFVAFTLGWIDPFYAANDVGLCLFADVRYRWSDRIAVGV